MSNRKKASLEELDNLHGKVAEYLAANLDDPKILSQAVKFLKDNDITADVVESEELQDIKTSIFRIANQTDEPSVSVDEMLSRMH